MFALEASVSRMSPRVPGSGRKSRGLVMAAAYLPAAELEQIDGLAAQYGVKRSDVLRAVVEAGLIIPSARRLVDDKLGRLKGA